MKKELQELDQRVIRAAEKVIGKERPLSGCKCPGCNYQRARLARYHFSEIFRDNRKRK